LRQERTEKTLIRSGSVHLKRELGFEYAELYKHPGEVIDPDFLRDLAFCKEKQE
jgi:hypothetical protein